jgi:hypothetical protein
MPRSSRTARACRSPQIVLKVSKQHFRLRHVPKLALGVGPHLGEPVSPVAGTVRDDELGLAECHAPRVVDLVAVDGDQRTPAADGEVAGMDARPVGDAAGVRELAFAFFLLHSRGAMTEAEVLREIASRCRRCQIVHAVE